MKHLFFHLATFFISLTGFSQTLDLEGYKVVSKIDFEHRNSGILEGKTDVKYYTGKNNSLFEVSVDPNVKSDNKGDYQSYEFRLTIVSSETKEYTIVSGFFRRYTDQGKKSKYWSEMNGCGHEFEETEGGWNISIDKDGTSCLGREVFKEILNQTFVLVK